MKLEQVRELKKELLELNENLAAPGPETRPGMVAIEIPHKIIKEWGLRVSNPHITLLYLPETNLYYQTKIARRIQSLLIGTKAFEIITCGQEWFGPNKDTRVVLVQPNLYLTELRLKIYDMMEREFPGMIDKKYPVYRPHIAIGKSDSEYQSVQTDCEFMVDTITIQLKNKETYKIFCDSIHYHGNRI